MIHLPVDAHSASSTKKSAPPSYSRPFLQFRNHTQVGWKGNDGSDIQITIRPTVQQSHIIQNPMKYLPLVLAAWFGLVLVGCGAGHPNLTSITVTPQSATTTSNPPVQVGYTATG